MSKKCMFVHFRVEKRELLRSTSASAARPTSYCTVLLDVNSCKPVNDEVGLGL